MIPAFIARLGLSVAAPWIIPAVLGSLLSLGGAGTWLAGWTDYKTAILGVVTVGLVGYLVSTNSMWGRIVAAVVIAAACYFKGRIDEGLEVELKINTAVTAVHQQYKEVSDAEKARQQVAADEARQRAEQEKLTWEAERQKLREALKTLSKEAIDDPDAVRDAFSADAIDRLNQLRFERKPAAPRNLDPKAKPRGSPVLDAPAMPTPEVARPN